jgi:hypothetical protein
MKEAGSYGDNVVENSCGELDIRSSLMYEMINFYEMYSDEVEIKSISDNPNCKWSKMRQLMRVKEPLQRAKLLEEVKARKLTVVDTEKMVNALNVGKLNKLDKNNSKKKKRYAPKSYFHNIKSKLERYDKQLIAMNSELAGLLMDIEGVIQSMDRPDLDEELWAQYLTQFQEVSDRADAVGDICNTFRDKQLSLITSRFEKYYEERAELK